MSTSTVKQLSGPPQPRKTEPKWLVVFGLLDPLSKGASCRFAARLTLFAACGLLCFATPSIAKAQAIHARISVTSVTSARIRIEAEVPSATNVLSFRNTYGDVLGLGERIEMVAARNSEGGNVVVQKLAPGEFQAAEKFTRLTYEVNVSEPSRPAQMSHVSWLTRDQGLFMLADLLPQRVIESGSLAGVSIQVGVPAGWSITSNITNEGNQLYWTDDPDKAVFLIG